jgi:DNA-binding NtrC family response regulator
MMNILVIDDDADDVELFCEALHEIDSQIQCHEFKKIQTALEFLNDATQTPEFIFLDAHMPSCDPAEFLKEISQHHKLHEAIIVIYSGYVSDREVSEFKRLGAHHVVIKPTSYDDLRKILSTLISG